MKILCFITFLSITLMSCTYSINLVHTNGTASDMIDETDTASASPNISIPKPL